MRAKSNSIQNGVQQKQRTKARHIIRPPLILFVVPSNNPVFKQLKDASGTEGYLGSGLVVQPGWHSNFRAYYFALLHILLETPTGTSTGKFEQHFEKALTGDDIRLDVFRAEQIDQIYRIFYNHDTLVSLLQDFIEMFRNDNRGKNLAQHLNQYPIIDLALVLFLRAIVNSINPPTLPPYSFSHVPSKAIASAITQTFLTPVEFDENTGESNFVEFGITLKEELGEVVIKEKRVHEKEGEGEKELTKEVETPFKELPFEESFITESQGEEQKTEKTEQSPMKDSCYLKLKELYESNIQFNNQEPGITVENIEAPVVNMAKTNKQQVENIIYEPPKAFQNRFQRLTNQPHRIQVLSNKKARMSPNSFEIMKKSPSKEFKFGQQTIKRNLWTEFAKAQQTRTNGLKPEIKIQSDNINEEVVNIIPHSLSSKILEDSKRVIQQTNNPNSNSGNLNSRPTPQTHFAYRQAPIHSDPPQKLQIRIEYHNRAPNQQSFKPSYQQAQPRNYKDLVNKPTNIRIPVGLFKANANSFASTYEDDNSQHRDILTLEPMRVITGTSSQHTRSDQPKLHIQAPRIQFVKPGQPAAYYPKPIFKYN